MGIEATGMPLEARQNVFIYKFILIAILVLAIVATLGFFYYKFFGKKRNSRITEKLKTRTTKYINCKRLGKIAKLTNPEILLLWTICKKNRTVNIEYSYKNTMMLDELFRTEYNELLFEPKCDQKIHDLFSLRFKIFKLTERSLSISSTKYLKKGQELIYKDKNDLSFSLILVDNNKNELVLSLPEGFFENTEKPKELSKISLTFSIDKDLLFIVVVRVIRYITEPEQKSLMLVTHSNDFKLIQRRSAKRKQVESICQFSAIKLFDEGTANERMQIMDTRYKGILTDISTTGCAIICGMPIKQDQFLNIYFTLPNESEEHDIPAVIVHTERFEHTNNYKLHVKFLNVPFNLSNKINAYIYGYERIEL